MLDVHQNLPAVPVSLDEHMQGIAMLHPTKQTRAWRKRGNGILLNTKMSLCALLVRAEKRIDKSEELHNSFILTQIFVSYMLA
jgi:hypothetical protein